MYGKLPTLLGDINKSLKKNLPALDGTIIRRISPNPPTEKPSEMGAFLFPFKSSDLSYLADRYVRNVVTVLAFPESIHYF